MTEANEALEQKFAQLVTELLGIPVAQVADDVSLDTPKFRTSVGAAILATAVKSRLGKTVSTAGVKTVGQLRAAILGESMPAASRGAAVPAPAAPDLASPGPLAAGPIACGVDMEDVATLPEAPDYWKHEFYREHFSPEEIAYCAGQRDPRQHFAARWCAKEALKKCSPRFMKLAFSQIQVANRSDGSVALEVRTGSKWAPASVALSLSHTPSTAVAMVVSAAEAGSARQPTGVASGAAPATQPRAGGTHSDVLRRPFWARIMR